MSNQPKRKNGNGTEPARVEIPRKGPGRPILCVADPETGKPHMSENPLAYLCWDKANNRFYRLQDGEKFGYPYKSSEYPAAVLRFNQEMRGEVETTRIANPQPAYDDFDRDITATNPDEILAHPDDLARAVKLDNPILAKRLSAWILNPATNAEAARILAIPELQRLATLPPVAESIRLADCVNMYLSNASELPDKLKPFAKSKPLGDDERRQVVRYWKLFADTVNVETLADIQVEHIQNWWTEISTPYFDGEEKSATLHNKFGKVKATIRYACIKRNQDNANGERILGLLNQVCELPSKSDKVDAEPISREAFQALLDKADTRWRAILLLALNACYYPCDIRRITVSAITDKNGQIKPAFSFRREKTDTVRVCVLWKETREALKAYLAERQNGCDWLFTSRIGTPYTAKGFNTAWRAFKGDTPVEFRQLRDGAYSAAANTPGVEMKEIQILAGHKFAGAESDKYIERNPQIVKPACEAIHKHYFAT